MSDESTYSLETGTVLNGKWVILEFVAKGGMGEVYRAHQVRLKRDVAIKVISREWIDSFDEQDYERRAGLQRFRHEVQAMARVRHPNVLQIFDYDTLSVETGGQATRLEYIAMEYVPGGTLRATMSDEGFGDEEDLIIAWLKNFFFPVLDGVQAIHELKMAHRDLKPSNVLMAGETPKIADFGLAHSYEWQPVTQSIDIKGSPPYMSPEHFFEFENADHRSDIYSLGKILFEAISGRMSPKSKPFKTAALQNPETPLLKTLDRIIQVATAEERNQRYASVAQMHTELYQAIERVEKGPTENIAAEGREPSLWRRPRIIWTGVALALASVMAMAAWHLMGGPGKVAISSRQTAGVHQPLPEAARRDADTAGSPTARPPEKTFLGQDGIRMRLVAGPGPVQPGDGTGDTVEAASEPFYIDEQNVSYYHFVEFLNAVKGNLAVENGVVKQKDRILFYLGEGKAPYEQVLYRHDRFHLRDTTRAADPVVRVTWYGAAAYAAYYGKRLPTGKQWRRYVASANRGSQETGPESDATAPVESRSDHGSMEGMHADHMMGQTMENRPGVDKIWITRSGSRGNDSALAGQEKDSSYSSFTIASGQAAERRYPWEGFQDVGFRCIQGVP